jgi:hypothetical protein
MNQSINLKENKTKHESFKSKILKSNIPKLMTCCQHAKQSKWVIKIIIIIKTNKISYKREKGIITMKLHRFSYEMEESYEIKYQTKMDFLSKKPISSIQN